MVWPTQRKYRGKWRHCNCTRKLHQSEGKFNNNFWWHLYPNSLWHIFIRLHKNCLSFCNTTRSIWVWSSFNPPGELARKLLLASTTSVKTGSVWACRFGESSRSLPTLPQGWILGSGLDRITAYIKLKAHICTGLKCWLHTHRWGNGWWNTWTEMCHNRRKITELMMTFISLSLGVHATKKSDILGKKGQNQHV